MPNGNCNSSQKNFKCSRCYKTFALKSYLNKHYESSCFKESGEGGKFSDEKDEGNTSCIIDDEFTSDVSSSTVVDLPLSPVSSVEADSSCASDGHNTSSHNNRLSSNHKNGCSSGNESQMVNGHNSSNENCPSGNLNGKGNLNSRTSNGNGNITQITTRTGRKAGRFDVSFMVNSASNSDSSYNENDLDEDENDLAVAGGDKGPRGASKKGSGGANSRSSSSTSSYLINGFNGKGKSDTKYNNSSSNNNNNNNKSNNHNSNNGHNGCNSLPSPSSSPASLGEESANDSLIINRESESVLITLPLRKRALPVEFTSSSSSSSTSATGERTYSNTAPPGKMSYRLSPPASPAATGTISAAE